MATNQRFAAWVTETKGAVELCNGRNLDAPFPFVKAVVFALLTIAIAIHEAAETKGK